MKEFFGILIHLIIFSSLLIGHFFHIEEFTNIALGVLWLISIVGILVATFVSDIEFSKYYTPSKLRYIKYGFATLSILFLFAIKEIILSILYILSWILFKVKLEQSKANTKDKIKA